MARRLHNAILGGNITDPEAIGELANYYRDAIYDEKTTSGTTLSGRFSDQLRQRLPKTPDYMAFDVSAEIPAMRAFDAPLLLSGRGRQAGMAQRTLSRIYLDQSMRVDAIDLPMTRVHGGKLLMRWT